jgi:hypothetical protein
MDETSNIEEEKDETIEAKRERILKKYEELINRDDEAQKDMDE